MPRRREVPKREILPDPLYNSVEVSKFVNVLMLAGKKAVAERMLYGAFDQIKTRSGKDPIEVFSQALQNCRPMVEVKSRRVGGANYQVPFQVRGERRYFLGCNWIIKAANDRKGRSTAEKLATEILDASNGEGTAVKKREAVHKMAEANKAFAHFSRSRSK